MLNSTILDMAIGLIFVYLVLSLVASAVSEMFESFLKNRATDLERGIRELLNDSSGVGNGLTKKLYDHPLVSGLFKGTYQPSSKDLPTYVPARNFALALMDIVLPATAGAAPNGGTAGALNPAPAGGAAGAALVNLAGFRQAITANVSDPKIQSALLALTDAAVNDADKLRQNIETWFNSSMDRVSGWYKRRSHWILFGIGFGIALLVGASSIDIAARLATDRTMRDVLAAQAVEAAKKGLPAEPSPAAPAPTVPTVNAPATNSPAPQSPPASNASNEDRNKELTAQLNAFTAAGVFTGKPLPLRWWRLLNGQAAPADKGRNPLLLLFLDLVGCLITACAVSLGAPFWFDLLNKFVVVRSTVKPHEKSPEEKSKA